MDPNYDLNQLLALPEEEKRKIDPREIAVLAERMRAHAERNQDPEAISKTMTFAKTEQAFRVRTRDFDADPYSFNVANGTLDLRTGELLPHKASDLLRCKVDVTFDRAATRSEER